jgi:hypothetical protein
VPEKSAQQSPVRTGCNSQSSAPPPPPPPRRPPPPTAPLHAIRQARSNHTHTLASLSSTSKASFSATWPRTSLYEEASPSGQRRASTSTWTTTQYACSGDLRSHDERG